jgi:hypothetical protein
MQNFEQQDNDNLDNFLLNIFDNIDIWLVIIKYFYGIEALYFFNSNKIFYDNHHVIEQLNKRQEKDLFTYLFLTFINSERLKIFVEYSNKSGSFDLDADVIDALDYKHLNEHEQKYEQEIEHKYDTDTVTTEKTSAVATTTFEYIKNKYQDRFIVYPGLKSNGTEVSDIYSPTSHLIYYLLTGTIKFNDDKCCSICNIIRNNQSFISILKNNNKCKNDCYKTLWKYLSWAIELGFNIGNPIFTNSCSQSDVQNMTMEILNFQRNNFHSDRKNNNENENKIDFSSKFFNSTSNDDEDWDNLAARGVLNGNLDMFRWFSDNLTLQIKEILKFLFNGKFLFIKVKVNFEDDDNGNKKHILDWLNNDNYSRYSWIRSHWLEIVSIFFFLWWFRNYGSYLFVELSTYYFSRASSYYCFSQLHDDGNDNSQKHSIVTNISMSSSLQ